MENEENKMFAFSTDYKTSSAYIFDCIDVKIDESFPVVTYTKDSSGKIVETEHDDATILAVLLLSEVIILNTHWFKQDWCSDAKETLAMAVLCNDIFAWGCADAEPLLPKQLPDLYNYWKAYYDKGNIGAYLWCCKERNERPQKPVVDWFNKHIDFEEFSKQHDLRDNCYD